MPTTPPPISRLTPRQVTDAIRAGLRHGREPVNPPSPEIIAKSAVYRRSLAHYRQHAQDSLAQGDYLQAAEKSWGAYTQTLKIIAADRGLPLSHHASIIAVAGRLATLVGASSPEAGNTLRHGLSTARSLHQHFYENDLPDETVTASTADVMATIDLLQQLFAPQPSP